MSRRRKWTIVQAQPHSGGCACAACLQFRAAALDKQEESPKPLKKPKEPKPDMIVKKKHRHITL